ncbi:hypothetical protein JTB14_009046 [Gonioctena quinquepunctata]|nr:hypothetical protein JTB14_009046 [Gonioctena quinquepunctata]
MEELENEVIAGLDYVPYFYKRYVDDYVLCIPINKLEYAHQAFNSFHPRKQLTIEKEQQHSINFSDINFGYTPGGDIETDWFKKNVWSQRYLHSDSNTPSVVMSLTNRVIRLAHGKNRPKNLKTVKELLIANNYPPTFFEPIIKK